MVGCAGKELELLWLLLDDLTFDVGDTVPLVPPFVGIHIVASPLVMTVILLLLDVELELTRLSCDTVLDEVLIEVTLMGLVVTETLALEEVPTVPLEVEPTLLLPVLIPVLEDILFSSSRSLLFAASKAAIFFCCIKIIFSLSDIGSVLTSVMGQGAPK